MYTIFIVMYCVVYNTVVMTIEALSDLSAHIDMFVVDGLFNVPI